MYCEVGQIKSYSVPGEGGYIIIPLETDSDRSLPLEVSESLVSVCMQDTRGREYSTFRRPETLEGLVEVLNILVQDPEYDFSVHIDIDDLSCHVKAVQFCIIVDK